MPCCACRHGVAKLGTAKFHLKKSTYSLFPPVEVCVRIQDFCSVDDKSCSSVLREADSIPGDYGADLLMTNAMQVINCLADESGIPQKPFSPFLQAEVRNL